MPGQPQHVIQRGNNRSPIFFADDDYLFFLECLRDGCSVHAYVLMTNHIHLLATPKTADGLSTLMQSVGRRYVQYINFTYRRTGTLWEGRYKSVPMDTDVYLMTCYRYIELNPVRARMVGHPRDYRWSSYHRNADGKEDPLVRSHALYRALDIDDTSRQAAYRKFFRAMISDDDLEAIRDATNRGWALASDRFKRKIETAAEWPATPAPRGGKAKGGWKASTRGYRIINRV